MRDPQKEHVGSGVPPELSLNFLEDRSVNSETREPKHRIKNPIENQRANPFRDNNIENCQWKGKDKSSQNRKDCRVGDDQTDREDVETDVNERGNHLVVMDKVSDA